MSTASGWHPEPDHPVQLVTTARESGREEQDGRVRRYLITMAIRTSSFVLAAVTQGWVRWTFVALAVFLPYVAVVAANAVRPRALGTAMTPPGTARQITTGADGDAPPPPQTASVDRLLGTRTTGSDGNETPGGSGG